MKNKTIPFLTSSTLITRIWLSDCSLGASAGISYIMGGNLEQIKAAIQNMFGSVTGMICDGAKAGCAMKVATCVFAAIQSALIVMGGRTVQPIEGIIEKDVEDTIRNISKLSREGMPAMDPLLLKIMIDKTTENR